MSQSQSADALVSVRLVVMDHYMATPVPTLDPLVSDFRGYNIKKVPILRIFGSTPAGQRACLHLHGIFPYMYVPVPDKECPGFVFRLAASLDKAINLSMQQGKASIQHVYKAVKVSGRPMYGYHPRQHNFIKIFFYNPFMVKRAAELLAGGAVMDQVLQPHESHINSELQFMMDYNLQGMNYIHLRHAVFRQGQLHDEYDDVEPFLDMVKNSPGPLPETPSCSGLEGLPPSQRVFQVSRLPPGLLLARQVERQAVTELELDAVAADILNHNDLSCGGMNPGLAVLWEEERQRRRELGLGGGLEAPSSPPRPAAAAESSESEKFWLERLELAIEQRREAEGGGVRPREAEDSCDPDATVNMGVTRESGRGGGHPRVHKEASSGHPRVYPAESSAGEERSLPAATQVARHVSSLSQAGLDSSLLQDPLSLEPSREEAAWGDVTVVDEEVIASQAGGREEQLEEQDLELADLLADLATEAGEEGSDTELSLSDGHTGQRTPRASQARSRRPSSARKAAEQEQEEEEETLEMSQVVWDADPSTTAQTEAALLEAAVTEQDGEEEGGWDRLDRTVMEEMARGLGEEEDMEDMFLPTPPH